MDSLKRYCKECNEVLHGRRDKQFCTDYCRASFYNRNHAEATNLMRRINYLISRNRRILAGFHSKGQTKVAREELLESGMNFNYYTNTQTTKAGKLNFFCYDHGYQEMDSQYIRILTGKETGKQ